MLPGRKAQAGQFLPGKLLGQAQEFPGAWIEGNLGTRRAPAADAAEDPSLGEAYH